MASNEWMTVTNLKGRWWKHSWLNLRYYVWFWFSWGNHKHSNQDNLILVSKFERGSLKHKSEALMLDWKFSVRVSSHTRPPAETCARGVPNTKQDSTAISDLSGVVKKVCLHATLQSQLERTVHLLESAQLCSDLFWEIQAITSMSILLWCWTKLIVRVAM
jgi:hypothetical protein